MSDIFILAPDPNGTCCDCSARMNVCDPCTTNPCSCALLIPNFYFDTGPFTGPFPDAATAQTVINNFVYDCLIVSYAGSEFSATQLTSGSSSYGSNILTANGFANNPPSISFLFSFNAKAGSTITVDVSNTVSVAVSLNGLDVRLLECTHQDIIDRQTLSNSSTFISHSFVFNIDTTGEYYMWINGGQNTFGGAFTSTLSATITSSDTFTVNPIIALYTNPSDPTTPLELEACPKLQLPILSESSHSYYSDITSAQNAIDTLTSNCVGYAERIYPSFTATSAGSSLSLLATQSGNIAAVVTIWGSVSITAGTLSISYNTTADGTPTPTTISASVEVYDQSGIIVAQDVAVWPVSSGTFSFPLSVSGKYIIKCVGSGSLWIGGPFFTVTGDFAISNSATLTVNPVQALYSNGANCPSRLDCTP